MSDTNRFAVIGLGRFGSRLARNLAAAGAEVIAIDRNPDYIEGIRDAVTLAVSMDATDEDALRSQGIDKVKVAIVGIGTAFEAAALVTSALRRIGVPRVIARATTRTRAEILSRIGATEVAVPEAESADRWAHRLLSPQVMDKIELGENHALVQIRAPEAWVGKTLEQLNIRKKYKLNIAAIRRLLPDQSKREDGYIIDTPMPDSRVELGDLLLVVGSNDAIEAISRKA